MAMDANLRGGLGRRLRKLACAATMLQCTFAAPSWSLAQTPDDTALQVQELRERLERLEARNAELEAKVVQRLPALPAANETTAPDGKAPGGAAPAMQGYEVGKDMSLIAKWNNGLVLDSPRGDFKAHVGGRLHQDWVFFDQDPQLRADPTIGDLDDGVFFRRLRVQVEGSAYEVFSWDLDIDFSASTDVRADDANVTISQLPWIGNFRLGHTKVAFGLESMNSSKFLTFMERALPFDAFQSEYDPGVLLYNTLADDSGYWAVGFHRYDPDDDEIDFGDGEYEFSARGTKLLFYDEPSQGRYLVHVGGSYSHRDSEFDSAVGRDVVRLRSRPEIRAGQIMPRFVDTGRIEADSMDLVGAEAAVVWGPWSVQAEYVGTVVNDAFFPASAAGTPRGDATYDGFYAYVSYFLTGENRVYDRKTARFSRVKPIENFWWVSTCDGSCLGRGAWELAARYSWVDLNDSGIDGGELEDVTIGLNWYLSSNIRVQWNYLWINRTVSAPAASGETQAVGMRLALDF